MSLQFTSNKKGDRITPVTVGELNDDVLLNIFDWYRLYNTTSDDDQGWNLERWWYKPIHVCRKWRHLILTSPTRLDLHLVCTYGIPVEDMLSHSPPLPLIIYYPAIPGKLSAADEEGAIFALHQPDRVRRIHFAAPIAVLCNLFKAMDCEFSVLDRLSLRLLTESRAGLGLPKKLLAPLLRHLTLSNISLPVQSQLLRQAEGLMTLRLWNLPASLEFHPAHLVAQLPGMSRLEVLMVQFYTPIPQRRFESPAQPTPITLPSLKALAFRGGSTYLEGILARINAPLLSSLNVEFFNQLTFNLSRLLHFVRTSVTFRFRSAEMHVDKEFVSVYVDSHPEGTYLFHLQVKCKPLGWQASCAAQICHTLGPFLARVESLTLGFHKDGSTPWQDEIDVEKWHGLLRTFAGLKSLQLTGGLVRDLIRSLQLNEGVLPSHLLPELRELMPSAPVTQSAPLGGGIPLRWGLQYDPFLSTPTMTAYCDRCQRWFPHDRALEQHKRDSSFHCFCNHCDLDFGSSDALRQHYIESGDHHYCNECDRHFNSEESRRQHMGAKHWYCGYHDRVSTLHDLSCR